MLIYDALAPMSLLPFPNLTTLMRLPILATTALLTTFSLASPALSESIDHTRQLLSTKQCPNCDLSGVGLVLTNLSGANLSGANLAGANLSRANLSGADLTGANLSGASLYGANLSGAKLDGAQVVGADLRDAYLVNVSFGSAPVEGAHMQGAIGIPLEAAKVEDFYRWGMVQGEKGDAQGAAEYFSQALQVDPNYAPAYLARSVARYQLLDRRGAMQDAQIADKLFVAQGNIAGNQTAQAFIKELQTPPGSKPAKSKGNFMNFLGAVGAAAVKLFLPF